MVLSVLLQLLQEDIIAFVKNELQMIQIVLSQGNADYLETQKKHEEVGDFGEEKQIRIRRTAFLKITLQFLRRMNHNELAESIQSSKAS